MRGLPIRVIKVLESLPAHTHPMDVMRTGVSMLGCVHPERESHPERKYSDHCETLQWKESKTETYSQVNVLMKLD